MPTSLAGALRHAARQLLKHPGFSVVAVLTLALGIGATTALFSVVYGVLLSPYPYARPHEIWAPGVRSPTVEQRMRPYQLREVEAMAQLPPFSAVMATAPGSTLLTGGLGPETVTAIRVSGNAFDFLGVEPLRGRTIQAFDISPGGVAQPVTVLSYGAWQRLFGGAEDVLQRTMVLDGEPHTIIGVMPPRFGWWTGDGVWLPLGREAAGRPVFPIVRLHGGVERAAAEQQLQSLQVELAAANPGGFPKDAFASTLTNYLDLTVASGQMRNSLRLLFWAVLFLLLIACANVANLQLARGSSRAREIAVRMSLGAARRQIVGQLLTESIVLSLAGGVVGLACAFGITHLMVTLMPGFFVPNEARIELNGFALAFCSFVSVCTGIISGLVPALHASRANFVHALSDESRGSSGLAGGRLRSGLVVAEVAISVILLGGAAMTVRSFLALQETNLGFRTDQVVTVQIPLPARSYGTADARNRFAQALLERLRAVPGVDAVTIGNGGLPFGGPLSPYRIEGQPLPEDDRRVRVQLVGEDYLHVLGVPLLRGRMLTGREVAAAERMAVINESAAALWSPGRDPIGRRMSVDILEQPAGSPVLAPGTPSRDVTIVGIVGDTKNDGLQAEPRPAVLVPYTLLAPAQRTVAVRTASTAAFISSLRDIVRRMDPMQPISAPQSFEEILGAQSAQPRFIMALFSLFAGLGLALAMAGLYSVLSYLVSMRTREIGIRMALGARQSDILRLISMTGCRLVGVGLGVGLAGIIASAGVLGTQLQLVEGSAGDPLAYLAVGALLAAVAMAASVIPARRAARIAPTEAMR